MGVSFVVFMALSLSLGVYKWMKWRAQERARADLLVKVAHRLNGDSDARSASGKLDGLAVTMQLDERGRQTEVSCELPPHYPLILQVRSRNMGSSANELKALGEQDPSFAAVFQAEGAPLDVAIRLLDQDTRSQMKVYSLDQDVELATRTVNGAQVLRFEWQRYPRDLDEAMHALTLVSSIAARVREAYAAADAAVPTTQAGGPFRPEVDDGALEAVKQTREAELASLAQVNDRRAQLAGLKLAAGLLFGAFILFFEQIKRLF